MIIARLSQAFYDQFGEQVANEMVNWLNAVDEEFRQRLKDWIGLASLCDELLLAMPARR